MAFWHWELIQMTAFSSTVSYSRLIDVSLQESKLGFEFHAKCGHQKTTIFISIVYMTNTVLWRSKYPTSAFRDFRTSCSVKWLTRRSQPWLISPNPASKCSSSASCPGEGSPRLFSWLSARLWLCLSSPSSRLFPRRSRPRRLPSCWPL